MAIAPSDAPDLPNFLLLSLTKTDWDSIQLHDALARRGLLVRECSDFPGLEVGALVTGPGQLVATRGHLRVAVRSPEQNDQLVEVLGDLLRSSPRRMSAKGRARALMVLGTSSHAGKSTLAAGFCRLLADLGHSVTPFKAQNMALNSFVTLEGGEIGRAQVAQAEAAGVEPETDMNPILLKPMGGVSQVIVDGSPIGVMAAREYYAAKDRLWPRVTAAYDRLASRFDRIVLEGAGSPVEINLTEHDLTNLRMARHADAAVVLVADIERGGVFAQIVGTWELMEPIDRARVVGFVINKFRGDVSLLDSGLAFLRERTGVPVLGVLPYRGDLQLDQEDSLGIDETATPEEQECGPDDLDIAVARFPGLSNFTDLWPLARVPGVRVRYVDREAQLGRPDLVILPGTRTTARDLEWLREVGSGRAAGRAARPGRRSNRPGDLRRLPDARGEDRRPLGRRVQPPLAAGAWVTRRGDDLRPDQGAAPGGRFGDRWRNPDRRLRDPHGDDRAIPRGSPLAPVDSPVRRARPARWRDRSGRSGVRDLRPRPVRQPAVLPGSGRPPPGASRSPAARPRPLGGPSLDFGRPLRPAGGLDAGSPRPRTGLAGPAMIGSVGRHPSNRVETS